jgi:hypothetical protein
MIEAMTVRSIMTKKGIRFLLRNQKRIANGTSRMPIMRSHHQPSNN